MHNGWARRTAKDFMSTLLSKLTVTSGRWQFYPWLGLTEGYLHDDGDTAMGYSDRWMSYLF